MSQHFITLIPADPEFVPEPPRVAEAKRVLAEFLPGAREIAAIVTEEIQFVDQGENFESVRCPACGVELETRWWQAAMDDSYQSKFRKMDVTTPCCSLPSTLNDLDYRFPAGFARFQLRASDPRQKETSPEQIQQLEQILGTRLRQIWTHY